MDILNLAYKYRLVILFFISFISTMMVFKPILRIALKKNIVDNPDARKLQKHPVPVMGGIAVFFGIAVGLCFYKTMIAYSILFPVFGVMTVMLFLGCIDDILSVKPTTRLAVECIAAITMIYGMKLWICNFQGLWGIDIVASPIGITLSIITFLGLLNAINMIDGIDGLSSAFCILILGCFGVYCFFAGYYTFSVFAAVVIGALLPFFLHNVFGWTTKMFIGDSGTLMMGTAVSAMVFMILSDEVSVKELAPGDDFSRIAFTLAVLSIPVGDTLRVMFSRMTRHKSPFAADRAHLHHLLLKQGFSYIGITMIEIAMDILVIAAFLLSWRLGASLEVQLYVVIAVTVLMILAAVFVTDRMDRTGSLPVYLQHIASRSHVERRGFWLKIQKLIDNNFEIEQAKGK
ncbi:MAG: undecaprenyl/decaprenyl-phosphate alpha-N-acetylglucosaminyl 1-phosphate transferase [Bacteroidales bacterium]|nr:undecaprenyl/decaprenyl-phosphate alpha-N-acetylglucosaminyl 1-phosphate transferase [Bacteroidales bacterium]